MSLTYFSRAGWGNSLTVMLKAISGPVTLPAPPAKYADDILTKMPSDLKGKTFLVTGCSRGMGYQLAKVLIERNAHVFMLNRKSAHAEKAVSDLVAYQSDVLTPEKLAQMSADKKGTIQHISCDLLDFSSVRSACAELKQHPLIKELGVGALVCNAGLMAQGPQPTKDGYDWQMQANHLSHFLLTHELWEELLRFTENNQDNKDIKDTFKVARVVQHSSGARVGDNLMENYFNKIADSESVDQKGNLRSLLGVDDKGNPKELGGAGSMAKWKRYQQSKRANIAFTYALAEVIKKNANGKILSTCAHPGACNSGLQGNTQGESYMDRVVNGIAVYCGMAPMDGACGVIRATIDPTSKNADFYGPAGFNGPAVLLPSENGFLNQNADKNGNYVVDKATGKEVQTVIVTDEAGKETKEEVPQIPASDLTLLWKESMTNTGLVGESKIWPDALEL